MINTNSFLFLPVLRGTWTVKRIVFCFFLAPFYFSFCHFLRQVHFTTFQLNYSTILCKCKRTSERKCWLFSKDFNFTCSSHERNEPGKARLGAQCGEARRQECMQSQLETLLTQKRLQFSIKLILRERDSGAVRAAGGACGRANANLFSYLLQLLEDVLKMNKKRGPPGTQNDTLHSHL